MMRSAGILLALAVASCRGGTPAPASPVAPPPAPPAPADSMVLRAGNVEVWLAEGRDAADSAGNACYERSVELRTDSTRTKVPLLFVTRAPVAFGPDAIRAELSLHCRTMAVYRVDLATGRPVKLEDR